MDLENFLARVIPPGNYFAICWNPNPGAPSRGFATRFFREGDIPQAAGLVRWADRKGFDVYHANASFLVAQPDGDDLRGNTKFKGERTQSNAQRLRSFWIDLDVKREGDKKGAGSCYPDLAAALGWLNSFRKAIGLPRPNLAVQSGYGLHAYWVLEDAMSASSWAPYADALKSAMLANGFVGDSGITSDAARLLRPAGTANHKAQPATPVVAVPQLAGGDYPNQLILTALTPFLGQVATRAHVGSVGASGSNVVALGGGRPAAVLAQQAAPNMAAAAQANIPQRHPWSFGRIAQMCQQTGRSLASHGLGDSYPLWYLGHLTLAHFCEDGAQFVHEIGKGDPRYSVASTDAAVAQVAREVANKGSGPAPCSHYDRANPGGCAGCPHLNRIRGPYELGNRDNDLPPGYRRRSDTLQYEHYDPLVKAKVWTSFVIGDVAAPVIDEIATGGRGLSFTYLRDGRSYSIYAELAKMLPDSGALHRTFQVQGIHLLPQHLLTFGKFIMAWVDQLLTQQGARAGRIAPFGWAYDNAGATLGFAVAGTLYRSDGTEEAAPGGDPQVVSAYLPRGTLQPWQAAFDLVTRGRPDLSAIIAASFAAPLMRFSGESGVTLSAWSKGSGVGKSAAMTIGQAVWSAQRVKCALLDTDNAVISRIAETRAMVCNWDEVRLGAADGDRARRFVDFLFMLTLGKEKARLQQDTANREVREWQTLLVVAANRPLMDYVTAETEATEAGALRVFEYAITRTPNRVSATAAAVIAEVQRNHGHAGAAYARWLALHSAKAQAAYNAVAADLVARLGIEQSERFYLAIMATMLTAARIVNRIGIAHFDVPALEAFLLQVFKDLREARGQNSLVTSTGYDLEQVLSQFVSENLGRRLITDRFATVGAGAKVEVKWPPVDPRCAVHIAVNDMVMRINRTAFLDWARRRNMSGLDVIQSMVSGWGVVVGRKSLGGGTHYSSGQAWALDIPLHKVPGLGAYLAVPAGIASSAGAAGAVQTAQGGKP